MDWDADRVRANARQAPTEDLLDRVTIYRSGMAAEAVEIIEAELRRRGIAQDAIDAYWADHGAGLIKDSTGTPRQCSFCARPAVWSGIGWQRLWGRLPLFPRRLYYCAAHG